MKVVLFVPRLHFHAPYVLRALASHVGAGEHSYLAVLTPKLSTRSAPPTRRLAELTHASGIDYLTSMAGARLVHLARGVWERLSRVPVERRRSLSVPDACRLLGARVVDAPSVRDPQLIKKVAGFRPDLLICVFFNQIVPEGLRAVPALAALNVHPSYLPSYRGISPCFWALARGETSTGVTVHQLTGDLDRGPIFAQDRVEITPGDTVDSLYRRCALKGGELLAGLMADPDRLAGGVEPPADAGSYFSGITRQAVLELRSRGRRFI